MHYVMAGPLPKRLYGSARACLDCGGTGLYENDAGEIFKCGYCLGNGIRTGLLSSLEWLTLGRPQRMPVGFIRETKLSRVKSTELALQEVCALLKHCIESEAASLGVSECAFYDTAQALHAAPVGAFFAYTEFDFPVLLCMEQCRWDYTLSGAATVAFGGPNGPGLDATAPTLTPTTSALY